MPTSPRLLAALVLALVVVPAQPAIAVDVSLRGHATIAPPQAAHGRLGRRARLSAAPGAAVAPSRPCAARQHTSKPRVVARKPGRAERVRAAPATGEPGESASQAAPAAQQQGDPTTASATAPQGVEHRPPKNLRPPLRTAPTGRREEAPQARGPRDRSAAFYGDCPTASCAPSSSWRSAASDARGFPGEAADTSA